MLAFIHMPKAAGTTLANVLRRNFGRRHFDTRFFSNRPVFTASDYRRLRWLYPELRSIAGHGITGTSDLQSAVPDIRFFTFLREPLSRTLSQFQFNWNCLPQAERNRWTPSRYFDDVILNEFANVQTRMLAGDKGATAAIEFLNRSEAFIGLTETYDQSLVMFRRWTNIPSFDIRYRSVNETKTVSNEHRDAMKLRLEHEPELKARLQAANVHDIQLYEFACEKHSQQVREYGPQLQIDLVNFQDAQSRAGHIADDQLSAQLYRNFVYKPLRRWIFSNAA